MKNFRRIVKEIILGLIFLNIYFLYGQLDYSWSSEPIYQGAESTALSIYDTNPESPDGKYICFTKYPEIAKGGHLAKPVEAQLMLKNRVSGKISKIFDVKCNNHNGVNAVWINDSLLAFQVTDFKEFVVYNIATNQIEFGPIEGELPHKSFGSTLYFSLNNARLLVLDPTRAPYDKDCEGIYALDVINGKINLVAKLEDITSEFMAQNPKVNSNEIKILHLEPNPSNDKLMFDFRYRNKTDQSWVSLHGFMYTDGTGTREVKERPMHVVWFDNNSMFGVDTKDIGFNIVRYDLYGKKIEVLGGTSTHVGVSPNRKWYVGEGGFYKPEKDGFTRVYLYKKGIKKPYALLAEWKNKKITWDWVAHVNPSFSSDGKRVYFIRASNTEDRFEAVYVDLSVIKGFESITPHLNFKDNQ